MKKLKVHLTGKLKEICDDQDEVVVGAATPRMAVKALESMYGHEVRKHIAENKWYLYDGIENDEDSNVAPQHVDSKLVEDDLYIVPYIEGAGGKTGQIILGIVLVVAGVFLMQYDGGATMQAGMQAMGAALISTGVGMILQAFYAPTDANMRERPEERNSFLFSGATNTSQQGQAVPLVFGRFRTGSVLVSAGLDVEQLMNYQVPPYDGGSGGISPIDPWFPGTIAIP